MSEQVVNGAMLTCSFGVAPAALVVLPVNRVTCGGEPAATINDHVPVENIPTFGMCTSIANPTVATATAAALGVLTPMPCVPVTSAPWIVGAPTVLIGEIPALNNVSTCLCNWLGVIAIDEPGQVQTTIPP